MPMFFKQVFSASVLVLAAGSMQAETADFDAGIDIQLDRSHQEFADESTNVTTVDIAPHLQYGNWDFSLDAPWMSADGNFVSSQFPPRVVSTCEKAAQYSSYAAKHPDSRIAKLLSECQAGGVDASDSVSGMSDITAFARYGILLDEQGIWLLSLGAGYKFDNGDVDENLGSGTRNTLLEASLGASYGRFTGSLTGGYAFVGGGDEETDAQYSYASLDLGVSPREWIMLGCALDYDESYVITADDVTAVTAYMKFKPWQHLRVKIYTRDFGAAEGYPEREYGGSMTLVY